LQDAQNLLAFARRAAFLAFFTFKPFAARHEKPPEIGIIWFLDFIYYKPPVFLFQHFFYPSASYAQLRSFFCPVRKINFFFPRDQLVEIIRIKRVSFLIEGQSNFLPQA
jgi:hypothetical protein